MAVIEIPKDELGTTRVMSLSMTAAEARRLRDNQALQTQHLGIAPTNPAGIEVFAVSDLGEMGLAGFLREGVDAHPTDINRDLVKLSALDGWVMLIHSSAFAETGARLTLAPALTLIGTYAQTPADQSAVPLEVEAAQPYTGTAPPAQPEVTRSRSPAAWIILALAGISIAVLLWGLT